MSIPEEIKRLCRGLPGKLRAVTRIRCNITHSPVRTMQRQASL
jgi:hypothetical protein